MSEKKLFLARYGSAKYLDKASNDEDIKVRAIAARHPNATKEHLDKALKDEDWQVRLVAAKTPNYKKYFK